jgi:hypothetical protein
MAAAASRMGADAAGSLTASLDVADHLSPEARRRLGEIEPSPV